MKRLVYSTFVLLFLLSLTIGDQNNPIAQQSSEDECWTYPGEAKAQKISGAVRVDIVIDETGRDSLESSECSQPKTEREQLMQRAEKEKFTLRRVEFLGLTYTPDTLMRRRMGSFNEGELFTRKRLVQSLANMSNLKKKIYPVRLSDVSIKLNDPEQTVDLMICFKSKRR